MEIQKFQIEKPLYGKNAGIYQGEISFKGEGKSITFTLHEEWIAEIVRVSSEHMYAGACEAAEELKEAMLESIALNALPEGMEDK